MKILKGVLLSFLGFLLGLCLSIFGLAYTIHSTALNPEFIRAEINELDIAALIHEFTGHTTGQLVNGNGISQHQVFAALSDTVTQMEPTLKERLTAVTDSIYDYLLGEKPHPELIDTLRTTILRTDFFVAVVDKIDLTQIIKQLLDEQLSTAPPEFKNYIDTAVSKVIVDIKPTVEQQINAALDPMLDYLVGKTENFTVSINIEHITASLKTALHEVVFATPPSEWAAVPTTEREVVFNQLFDNLAGGIETSIQLDQSIFGPSDARQAIAEGLRQAEEGLIQAKQYVAYFQLGYTLLIVLILVLLAGIILIYREMKGSTRYLSVILLSYGTFELAGALVARYLTEKEFPRVLTEIPASLQTWVTNFADRLLVPLLIYSIVLMVAGIMLLIVFFVYPKPKTGIH